MLLHLLWCISVRSCRDPRDSLSIRYNAPSLYDYNAPSRALPPDYNIPCPHLHPAGSLHPPIHTVIALISSGYDYIMAPQRRRPYGANLGSMGRNNLTWSSRSSQHYHLLQDTFYTCYAPQRQSPQTCVLSQTCNISPNACPLKSAQDQVMAAAWSFHVIVLALFSNYIPPGGQPYARAGNICLGSSPNP